MDMEHKLAELKKRDQLAEQGGGPERRERQHKEGKLRRLAGVSEAGARSRNPERSEGTLGL